MVSQVPHSEQNDDAYLYRVFFDYYCVAFAVLYGARLAFVLELPFVQVFSISVIPLEVLHAAGSWLSVVLG